VNSLPFPPFSTKPIKNVRVGRPAALPWEKEKAYKVAREASKNEDAKSRKRNKNATPDE
jgi:hypothetical protein